MLKAAFPTSFPLLLPEEKHHNKLINYIIYVH